MADKRTTPEAGENARRRKRAAPTIDLTATEVQPAASEPAPQPEPVSPSMQEPPPAVDEVPPAFEEAAATMSSRPETKAAAIWPIFAAGFAGAALAALLLLALWSTDLLPGRSAAVPDTSAQVAALEKQVKALQNRPAAVPDMNAIDALNQRLAKLEDTVGKLPVSDAGITERIAAAENAMKSLGVALAALNKRGDDVAANAAQARERADAAENAVSDLRGNVQAVAKDASAAVAPAELDALQTRIAALEQSAKLARDDIAKTSASDIAARLALSAAALRIAVVSGAPFSAELAQVKSLGGDEESLAPIAPFAATGVPAPAVLAQELHALLPVMLKLSGAQAPASGFLERLQANAGQLVRIQPVDRPIGDDPSAVLARIEIDAAHADIAAALADLGKLSDATRAPAQAWIAKAQARQAALAASRAFAADAARALGPR